MIIFLDFLSCVVDKICVVSGSLKRIVLLIMLNTNLAVIVLVYCRFLLLWPYYVYQTWPSPPTALPPLLTGTSYMLCTIFIKLLCRQHAISISICRIFNVFYYHRLFLLYLYTVVLPLTCTGAMVVEGTCWCAFCIFSVITPVPLSRLSHKCIIVSVSTSTNFHVISPCTLSFHYFHLSLS